MNISCYKLIIPTDLLSSKSDMLEESKHSPTPNLQPQIKSGTQGWDERRMFPPSTDTVFTAPTSTKNPHGLIFQLQRKAEKEEGPLVRYNNTCRFPWINCQHWHCILQLAACDEWYPVAPGRAAAARQHGWLRALLTGWWIRKLKRDPECESRSGKCFHLSLLWSSLLHLYRTF